MRRPSDLGLPAKFAEWRPYQRQAVIEAAAANTRFVTLNKPTGSGKSVTYMAIARLLEGRTAYLTSTKGLQNQLDREFPFLADVRGQANYHCRLEQEAGLKSIMVDQGGCHVGVDCQYRGVGCYYFDKVREASRAPNVLTNYSFWLSNHYYGEGLGKFDNLILDEAHEAPEELAGFLSISISDDDLGVLGVGAPPSEGWRLWADHCKRTVESRLQTLTERAKREKKRTLFQGVRELKSLGNRFTTLMRASSAAWVMDRNDWEKKTTWDPVDIRPHAELLFQNTPKVILTSATVMPRTLERMGIKSSQNTFKEFPSTFPVERRPVIWVPTVQMNYHTEQDPATMRIVALKVDQILNQRKEKRGIIHTVSYKRRDQLLDITRNRLRMMTHNRHNTREVVEEFKKSKPGTVLVSPSMTTGWDFPYEECEFQIILKIGFPDTRSKVMKARCSSDKELSGYMAMVDLVQTVGRGMRAEDDMCETIILDDSITWFLDRYKKFAPKWFLQSVRTSQTIPKPLGKLRTLEGK